MILDLLNLLIALGEPYMSRATERCASPLARAFVLEAAITVERRAGVPVRGALARAWAQPAVQSGLVLMALSCENTEAMSQSSCVTVVGGRPPTICAPCPSATSMTSAASSNRWMSSL